MLFLKGISNKKAGVGELVGFLTQHPYINELFFSHKNLEFNESLLVTAFLDFFSPNTTFTDRHPT